MQKAKTVSENTDSVSKVRQMSRVGFFKWGNRSGTRVFKQFPGAKCFPANAMGLASSLLATEIVRIFLSIEHADQRKEILMVSRIQIGHISAI
jgi:hypothetical protein